MNTQPDNQPVEPASSVQLSLRKGFLRRNWDPRARRQAAQRTLWLFVIVLFLAGVLEMYAVLYQPVSKALALPPGIGVLVVLLLFGLMGLVINQVLELIFAFIERNALDIVSYAGYGLRWLHGTEIEVGSARSWLADVTSEANRLRNEVLDTSPERLQSMTPEQRQAFMADTRKVDLTRQAKTPDSTLSTLRQQMADRFSEEEIRDLCFDSGVDYESLSGDGKGGKVRELIKYMENRGHTSELIAKCNELRSGQFGSGTSEGSAGTAGDQTKLITVDDWYAAVRANAQAKLETADTLVELAKRRVMRSENDQALALEAPQYIKAKRIFAVILSFLLGLLAVLISQLQIFAMLGVSTLASNVDLLLSGLIMGSGALPVHALMNAVQAASRRA